MSPSSYDPDKPKTDPALTFEPSLPTLSSASFEAQESRPRIAFNSVAAFSNSSWRRFTSMWTRRFILSLLAGQVVSLCITCTNVTTTELMQRNWSLPTTQTFFLYALSFCLDSHSLERYCLVATHWSALIVQVLFPLYHIHSIHHLPM